MLQACLLSADKLHVQVVKSAGDFSNLFRVQMNVVATSFSVFKVSADVVLWSKLTQKYAEKGVLGDFFLA